MRTIKSDKIENATFCQDKISFQESATVNGFGAENRNDGQVFLFLVPRERKHCKVPHPLKLRKAERCITFAWEYLKKVPVYWQVKKSAIYSSLRNL